MHPPANKTRRKLNFKLSSEFSIVESQRIEIFYNVLNLESNTLKFVHKD